MPSFTRCRLRWMQRHDLRAGHDPVVWFLESSRRLSIRARSVLRDPNHTFILPTIVLVEITYLYT